MKHSRSIHLAVLLFSFVFIGTCKKSCNEAPAACREVPPTNEECLAYYERWFYTGKGTRCEKKSYSGCNSYGFETQEECEESRCR